MKINILYFSFFIFLFSLESCYLENCPPKSTSIEGVLLNELTDLPIPYTKIWLTESRVKEGTYLLLKDSIAFQITNEQGAFQFDYKVKGSHTYGLTISSKEYFSKSGSYINEYDDKTTLYAYPNTYLQIRIVDKPPIQAFDSVSIRNSFSHNPKSKILENFSDTTITHIIRPNFEGYLNLKLWNQGQRIDIKSSNYYCAPRETCKVIIEL